MAKKEIKKSVSNQQTREESKARRRKGKPSGNRNSLASVGKNLSQTNQSKDPRVGSKKPISLTATNKPVRSAAKRYSTPQAELMAIEGDKKLQELMDKLDNNVSLSDEDQRFFDRKMARHLVLCNLIGESEPVEEPEEEEDSIFTDSFFSDLGQLKDE